MMVFLLVFSEFSVIVCGIRMVVVESVLVNLNLFFLGWFLCGIQWFFVLVCIYFRINVYDFCLILQEGCSGEDCGIIFYWNLIVF